MSWIDYGTAKLSKPDEACIPAGYKDAIDELFNTWSKVRARNARLSLYYNMENRLKDLGISIPENMIKVACIVGWCKKAIDVMAVRSIFDGFAFKGIENTTLSELVEQNKMRSLIARAGKASLIHGLSNITVMAGGEGQPAAKVRAHSANQSAVVWDKDEERIGCGIVLNDTDKNGNATKYTAHFPDAVLIFSKVGDKWKCDPKENPLGRPLMEPLVYDPDLDKPLGHSALTKEILGIVDKAMRDVLRMEVGAEFFTFPQRYVLGAAEDLFSMPVDSGDDDNEDEDDEEDSKKKPPVPNDMAKFMAYIGSILAISRDENGDIPSVGQFNPSSAENFTAVFENDAQRFSGATNVPLAQLGVLSNNYTSSDALSAANDPLILAVETMNQQFTDSLVTIADMMMHVAGDPLTQSAQVVWKDPAMPTLASRADARTKLASTDKSIVGTRVFWEQVGLPQQIIDRLEAEKRQNGAIASLNSIAKSLAAQEAKVND